MHTYFSSVANTVDENASADDIDEEMVLKNWASFTDCINKINNTDAENAKDLDLVISMYNSLMYSNNPMDTSSLIIHRFDVEIARGKFEEITSILKGESTWKLWHRFDVDISTWIWLSKSTKYRWVLQVDFSISFRRQIDVTSVLAVSIF